MTWQVMDGRGPSAYKRRIASKGCAMRFVVPVVLVTVAVVHALPLVGVLGADTLTRLYGSPVKDASLELLLRHRAVLFGLLAAFMGYAATQPDLHRLALLAGLVSVVSFLVLAWLSHASAASALSAELTTVVRVDAAALVLLVVALALHLRTPN